MSDVSILDFGLRIFELEMRLSWLPFNPESKVRNAKWLRAIAARKIDGPPFLQGGRPPALRELCSRRCCRMDRGRPEGQATSGEVVFTHGRAIG
jgi:hypothetical protein